MTVKRLKNTWNVIKGYLVSAVVFGAVIGIFLIGVLSMSDRMD